MSVKITDEMVRAALAACPLNYFQPQGDGTRFVRCSVNTDDIRLMLEAALAHTAEKGEAEFRACVAFYEDGNYSQMLLEDCPTVTGYPPVLVEALYAMSDREKIVGFQWPGKTPPAPRDDLVAEVENNGWHPIDTCPFRTTVDLWCVYGGEEFAQYEGGASIGQLVSSRHRTLEYGFFGNQSNDGVPRKEGPDLKPVAWRPAVPMCPPEIIAAAMNVPVTYAEAVTLSEGRTDA